MKTLMRGAFAVAAALAVPSSAQAQSPQDCFLGEVRMFAGNFAPQGWALAQGQIMAIAQNTALFSILGTTYGGNGQTTFALPDFRGRVPLGPGQGPGLTNRDLGEMGGDEAVVQTVSELAPHNHLARANSKPATHIRPQGRIWAKVDPVAVVNAYSEAPSDSDMAPDAISPTGGGQPQQNMPPYLGINFIVCLEGTFPSRN
jgi:microcystin-dependent protein